MTQPYPLQWPDNIRRSHPRIKSQFRTGLTGAMNNVRASLAKFANDSKRKVDNVVISSNVTLGEQRPNDPGVAVWFTWDGDLRCIAVDRYNKVECNLQAIHHVLEARRTEVRHAGIEMTRATFKGFIPMLAAPDATPWWRVLGFAAPCGKAETIRNAYKIRVRTAGEAELKELNIARDIGLKEVGGG